MKQTALERLIQNLPPDHQAAAMDALLLLSQHPDGPIFTLYAEMFERIERHEKEVTAAVTLHASSTKAALNSEITKHFAEQEKSAKDTQMAIRTGHVPGPLRRTRALLNHSLFSAFIILVVIFGYRVSKPKAAASPSISADLNSAEKLTGSLVEQNDRFRLTNNNLFAENKKLAQELSDATVRQTTAEVIGDALQNQKLGIVTRIETDSVTLSIPKGAAKLSGQNWLVEVKYMPSSNQYEILEGKMQQADSFTVPE